MTEFSLAREVGSRTLVTRDQGARALKRLAPWLESPGPLTIELESVDAMSPSFTDEFFGGVVDSVGLVDFNKLIRVSGADSVSRLLIERVVGAHIRKRRSQAIGDGNHLPPSS